MTTLESKTPDRELGKLSVVLVAAGQSSRMHGIDKLMMQLDGTPVIGHSLKVFEECDLVRAVVVVAHSSRVGEFRRFIAEWGFAKSTSVVAGGDRRQDSVRNGIEELNRIADRSPLIAVHDAARPFINDEMLKRGLIAAERIGAAIPVVPLKDTIKRAECGLIVETPDRDQMLSVQTPQIFRSDVLRAAHATVEQDVTDDATMVEIAGGLVGTFQGSYSNIKITTQSDIPIAQSIAKGTVEPPAYRYGVGFDGHRLVSGGPLVLGGTEIEFDHHLKGHSDGDVLLHAVSSAILGAAGLGDLGSNFPSDDPKYRGVSSALFVRESKRSAASQGWSVEHVDATVIAQKPRLASHVASFESNIAGVIGIGVERVNVKITSTDEVGAIGQGEGIAAQAIVTLVR